MSYTASHEVFSRLTTKKAREAFAVLDAMGPRWVLFEKNQQGEVYLSPTLEIKEGSMLKSVGKGYARTFNQAVVAKLKGIKSMSKSGQTVVANAYSQDRHEFTYDKKIKMFKIKSCL